MNECQSTMKKYLSCLKEFEGVSQYCEEDAKVYLKCRMDKGLMAKEPMTSLGYEKD